MQIQKTLTTAKAVAGWMYLSKRFLVLGLETVEFVKQVGNPSLEARHNAKLPTKELTRRFEKAPLLRNFPSKLLKDKFLFLRYRRLARELGIPPER